jgi:hypothetical protein
MTIPDAAVLVANVASALGSPAEGLSPRIGSGDIAGSLNEPMLGEPSFVGSGSEMNAEQIFTWLSSI